MAELRYAGPFRVLPRPERGTRPVPGEIIRHAMPDGTPTGSYRLRCPICNAISQVWGEQIGDPDAPTFDRPLRCGCRVRCGGAFRIRAGRAELVPPDDGALIREPIPERLTDAGVRYGPRSRRVP